MTATVPPLLLRRLSRGQLLAFDGALAAAVALLGWYAAAESPLPSHTGWHEPGWVAVVAGLLLGVPVALRRLRPAMAALSALAIVAVCVASGMIPDYAGLAPTFVLCLVLYTVGIDVPRRRSVQIVIVSVVVAVAVFLVADGEPFVVGMVAWVIGACWAVGRTVRERRAHARRAAEQATELAVGEERLRIARELHDIVAHSMSMIAVKATIADHVADTQPQEMREALRVIATTSRDALGELRRALGVLRTEGMYVPTPGLADLDELVAAARSSGLAVDLEVRGAEVLPESVGLAVFRLVQEALTNVVKHAGATSCRVDVDIGTGSVRLAVADNGTGAGQSTAPAGQPRPTGRAQADFDGQGPPGPRAIRPIGLGPPSSGGHESIGLGPPGSGGQGRDGVGPVSLGGQGPVGAGLAGSGGQGPDGVGPVSSGGQGPVEAGPTGSGRQGSGASAGGVSVGAGLHGAGGSGGQGLIGMRERAAMFGGELIAGPAPGGGWVVATTLRWAS